MPKLFPVITPHLMFVSNAQHMNIRCGSVACVLWCISKSIYGIFHHSASHISISDLWNNAIGVLHELVLIGFWVYLHRLPGVGCVRASCGTKKRLSKYMPLKHSNWIEINGLGTTDRYKRTISSRDGKAHIHLNYGYVHSYSDRSNVLVQPHRTPVKIV